MPRTITPAEVKLLGSLVRKRSIDVDELFVTTVGSLINWEIDMTHLVQVNVW